MKRLPPARGDVAAILLAIAIAVAALFAFIKIPNLGLGSNVGFGPDWDCTYPGNGDPVCIKKYVAPRNSN